MPPEKIAQLMGLGVLGAGSLALPRLFVMLGASVIRIINSHTARPTHSDRKPHGAEWRKMVMAPALSSCEEEMIMPGNQWMLLSIWK